MALNYPDLNTLFTAIADAIREKNNTTAKIVADNFPEEILALEIGGGEIDTSDATATADMIQSGYTAYVNGSKITGTLPVTSSFAFPLATYGTAAVSNSSGTAITLSLNNPTRTIVEANSPIMLQAAPPLFGTVSAADVISGQTFTSTAGLKQTGTLNLDAEISEQENLIAQIQAALQNKFGE